MRWGKWTNKQTNKQTKKKKEKEKKAQIKCLEISGILKKVHVFIFRLVFKHCKHGTETHARIHKQNKIKLFYEVKGDFSLIKLLK